MEPQTEGPEDDVDVVEAAGLDRNDELSTRKKVRDQLIDIFQEVEKGFEAQYQRSNDIMDYWDIFHTQLGPKQFYNGNSQIFVPIVRNAVTARKTRFTNQIFPISGRYVECTSEDGTIPHSLIALLEHYVRKAKLRTQVMPALMKNGDVEGQYSIYVSWTKNERHVVQRVKKPVEMEGLELDDDVDDVEEKTIVHGYPVVEVIADTDLCILPATSDSIDEAIANGGSVTILRRWTKAKIKKMIADGEIEKKAGDLLCEEMTREFGRSPKVDKAKEMTDAAGIRQGRGKFAQVYETWTMLKIGKDRRLCRAYYGGFDNILGCKRNPNWSDKLPLISAPVEKVQGSFKGRSMVEPVATLQYQANDAVNEGMDSAAYALMPIIMTDPAKNPRVGSMILSMAAIWETSPTDTQFAKFPELWKDALEIVSSCKSEIMQSLGVNPAAITQQGMGAGKKMNQAQIAQEQQVDLLTTADAVTVIEEGILTPLLNRMIEMDHQYRDEELTVRQYGEMGTQAKMEKIPPVQFNRHYQFRWFGVEAARNAQQVQQQIAGMNVLRGIPPEQLGGYKVNLVPIITQLVENTYGPRLAPLIFESPAKQMPVPIQEENMMLMEGYEVPVHQMDDDKAHIMGHQQLMQQLQMQEGGGKNQKKILAHIWAHIQQAQQKQQAQMQAQQGQPGVPGGAGPGVAGSPKPGAQPMMPRGPQNPPGSIHQDRMVDPSRVPRRSA